MRIKFSHVHLSEVELYGVNLCEVKFVGLNCVQV